MSRIVLGPNCRFSYASVFAPNKDGKYAVDVLISKQDTETLNKVFAAYNETLQEVATDSRFKSITPQHPSFKHCLKDGDQFKPNDAVYAGHYYFTAKSNNRPEVVGPATEPLSSETQFYSGCYGNVSVEFRNYAPSQQVPQSGYGANAALGNIQKVRDGERLSGGASASSEFTQVGPPSTGAPAAPAQFGAPAVQAPYGHPAAPAQYGAPAAPQPQGFPAPQPFGAPVPNPFAPPVQAPAANPFGAPAPQAPYGAPAAPVNPAAPLAPWPGAAAAPQAPASTPAMPWQQNQYSQ